MIGLLWLRTLQIACVRLGPSVSKVLGIRLTAGTCANTCQKGYQLVAQADSNVGGNPVPSDRLLPQP